MIPPIVIVAWTQSVATLAWLTFFAVSGHAFTWSRAAWPAVLGSALLVAGMATLIARASARGDISIVGPVYALSPIFTVLPDAVLSGTLPTPLGWLGLALALAGTSSLARGAGGGDRWGALALGPPSYLVCSHGATAILTTTIALVTTPRGLVASTTPANLVTVVTHGLLGVTGTGMQTAALTMAPAAYVNAIRRLSGLVAVVLGRTLFREADLGRRLTAAALACAGAACLLLAH